MSSPEKNSPLLQTLADCLLSLDDVAIAINLSRRQVDRLIARGTLPQPTKQGRRSMLYKSQVEAYLESIREQTA